MSENLSLSSNSTQTIQILLATYNGARFLAEQIASIQAQTFGNWRLLVRDDGSTDDTREILRARAARDERIEVLSDGRGNLGVLGNFAALAAAALDRPARYVAFADQDDVWHPQKLAWQLEHIRATEQKAAAETPIAVHTDLAVVDGQLQPLHPSFLRYQGLWHEAEEPLRTLVVQNFVTGCTLLINRPLLELAVPIPPEALVHDWWLALCAAAAGHLEFLPQATVSYRQHGGNTIGAKRWWSPRVWPKLRQLANRGKSLRESSAQASVLRQRLRHVHRGESAVQQVLETYGGIRRQRGAAARIRDLRRCRLRRQGWLRNAVLWAQVCILDTSHP